MAHVAGWGTRAGAYTAGQQDAGDVDLMEQLESTPARTAPVDVVDRSLVPTQAGPSTSRVTADDGTAPAGRVALRTARRVRTQAPTAPETRRRRNPLVLVPYLIGLLMFALMAVVYV